MMLSDKAFGITEKLLKPLVTYPFNFQDITFSKEENTADIQLVITHEKYGKAKAYVIITQTKDECFKIFYSGWVDEESASAFHRIAYPLKEHMEKILQLDNKYRLKIITGESVVFVRKIEDWEF